MSPKPKPKKTTHIGLALDEDTSRALSRVMARMHLDPSVTERVSKRSAVSYAIKQAAEAAGG